MRCCAPGYVVIRYAGRRQLRGRVCGVRLIAEMGSDIMSFVNVFENHGMSSVARRGFAGLRGLIRALWGLE